ncbi:hypothetical protein PHYBLDRAFT_152529 [Phycomyces blakesleeanus NRRL 1555(-)]|uniref:Uncharacterized protein n=1 Tax=Phycomyces blakesleeanus (strain ATCC 8743b / DSM 1359 / FGSC 10004 / NBRC 33097 / NRRL 1555) TaxID=763407 RepID=A0A167JPT5_PHYB8|nr:hypothetical protein PHYBLDRAFT_152529 [Phycomyces blakesleeanus NRRL 1555(-)]OAD66457.1 hypothetical protein PHYBLDRAFT_152529 [Phycomyces blakesleeanus NRRL 1555(-)]|eukprot:XP_018284497.1 hypothetical protein PHYBLDRAFT_152529 [Phycomyces blakesleeanus NRRL 1555(-)]
MLPAKVDPSSMPILSPFSLYYNLQITNLVGVNHLVTHMVFEIPPKMLNEVEIWALSWYVVQSLREMAIFPPSRIRAENQKSLKPPVQE